MSIRLNDINDDEIRVISSNEAPEPKRKPRRVWLYVMAGVAIVALIAAAVMLFVQDDDTDEERVAEAPSVVAEARPAASHEDAPAKVESYTVATDTVIDGKGLLILSPENARPRLVIGSESLNDSNIVLAAQAADIRSDNGKIAGAFVLEGELISKGEAKAGFCSIINSDLTIGISDATPMLEQALTENGYFFRQYPLVVGGQIVENKPKGRAIRKALAEIGDRVYVVMSKEKLTFHDFSQLLIDLGVRNAIYLVGSSSYGFFIDEDGGKTETGKAPWTEVENVSYIVWERR